jgi:hypothetical protein
MAKPHCMDGLENCSCKRESFNLYSCASVFENNNQLVSSDFDVRESVHRDTTTKISNKMHYID